nr:MAG TPA: hypothetical protein [Caudoviricetes sp.]
MSALVCFNLHKVFKNSLPPSVFPQLSIQLSFLYSRYKE